jgi:hypothetical protein
MEVERSEARRGLPIWAPPDSPWSPWAIPVPFVQMVCVNPEPPNDISVLERLANGFDHAPGLALVVDLPGGEAVRFALSLALRGFRPVPVIDAWAELHCRQRRPFC